MHQTAPSAQWAQAGRRYRYYVCSHKTIGASVAADDLHGLIANPYEDIETEVRVSMPGLVIGRTNLEVVNQGDALFHVAQVPSASGAERKVGAIETKLGGEPLFDDDEII